VATDKLGHAESAPAQPDTQTQIVGNAWQNPANPRDVNPDGKVVPLDVLAVINELNNRRFSDAVNGKLLARSAEATFYYDVNGDTFATPLDALNIINFLNSGGGEGEGELTGGDDFEDDGDPITLSVLVNPFDRAESAPAPAHQVLGRAVTPHCADARVSRSSERSSVSRFDVEDLFDSDDWHLQVDEIFSDVSSDLDCDLTGF